MYEAELPRLLFCQRIFYLLIGYMRGTPYGAATLTEIIEVDPIGWTEIGVT